MGGGDKKNLPNSTITDLVLQKADEEKYESCMAAFCRTRSLESFLPHFHIKYEFNKNM